MGRKTLLHGRLSLLLFSLLLSSLAFAQDRTIVGTVTDVLNNAVLPGVTVSVKGTTTAVQTDADGKYSIAVPATAKSLLFSFVGYVEQEVSIPSSNNLSVALALNSQSLENVVVVGYGTQKKKEATAAVDHLGPADFRQSGARNALDLAVGKVAGLQITRTGGSNPNSGVRVLLRGAVSTSNIAPLYVIDGIPGGNLDLLQQEDVESIDVIKDGAGAAIYGTQANGGVILITTKKGKAGPPRYEYANYFRKEYIYNRPDFLSPSEFKEKVASGALQQVDYGNSTDFFDALVNHSNLSQYHSIAASGGTDKANYRGTIYFRDLQGISLSNSRREYGGRVNFNQKGFNDMLTMSVNLATNINYADLLGGGGWEDQLTKNPTLSHKNPDGTWYFEQTSTNQLARLNQETSDRQQQTSSADVRFTLEPIKNLKASIFGSMQRNAFVDGGYRKLASESSVESYLGTGFASKSTSLGIDYAVEPTLEYSTTIKKNHAITGIVGYSYRYSVSENFSANNYGFLNDVFEDDNIGTGNQLGLGKAGMGSGKGDNTLIAFLGRINYAFKGKYLAQVIFRREGSSRFGTNNKWGNFPAGSIGWNIHEEEFAKDFSWLSNLKLRAGFGITGNQLIPNGISLVTLGGGGVYIYPDGQYRETYGPNRNPNPNLRWEKKEEWNVGIDFGFLKGRISGAIELYTRQTKDLLGTFTSAQPPYVRDNIYTNVGTIAAKGIEVTINAIPVRTKDFTWSVDLTGNSTRNWVKEWSNDVYKVQYRTFAGIGGFGALGDAIVTFEGGQIGQFFGKRYAGLSSSGDWLFYNRKGEKVANAQINNSLSDMNATDLSRIGNAIPKLYLQLTNNFQYKSFDFRFFLRGKFGHDILNTMNLSYGNQVSKTNLLRSAFTTYKDIKGTYMYSDYYIEKGDYVKVDEITLGYTLKLKSTKFIRNLRIYATGQNLFTITGYSGNDPDFIADTGLDAGVDGRGPYPSTRSVLVGLNLGF